MEHSVSKYEMMIMTNTIRLGSRHQFDWDLDPNSIMFIQIIFERI